MRFARESSATHGAASRESERVYMRPVLIARLALGVSGIVVWGVGARAENSLLRWTGIGLLVLTLVLRFAKDRRDN
jgi:hypothetical protein